MTKAKKKDMRGFPHKCRKKWSFSKWESCLKKVEKKNTAVNKYAVCNSMCLKESRKKKNR